MSSLLKIRERVMAARDLGDGLSAGHLGTIVAIRGIDADRGQSITVWFDGLLGEHDLPGAWVSRADPSTSSHMSADDRRLVKAAIGSRR